jgi:adenosylcobinamide kinase/adenosylcobinamide-phosphate guanylyltransferase
VVLVLGGARSGKSLAAERMASRWGTTVTYLATAVWGDDADFAARVEQHRRRRPPTWITVETGPELPQALARVTGPVLVDSLGTWLASSPDLRVDVQSLCAALVERDGPSVLVGEEVGMGVHPETEVGRRFRDRLGDINRAVAGLADEVYLVVAGRLLGLERP